MIRKVSNHHTSGLAWFKSSYSDGNEGDSCVEVAGAWFKSSYSSGAETDSCVEVTTRPGTVHVRDSKNVDGPRLAFAPAAWANFIPYTARG
ncbi:MULTISPECIES: DUF397 domain-containing protein [unclassified Streptomyces]|uniref:DUF397 domain-containing protein n=1 Tax=unclassified Streptomyces TaxID=2593676 RepID=UPI000F6DB406|nr:MULTISPECIES: DUF397 domain-containing protein [unclassified Streptomyces]AZM60202.1 DUF397 domain-containing protein [Streptomyces sp. WAC 01438]RSM97940.1 DUF397 domain-containing protein [Streptomyces sp. WAC 01420]